MITLASASLSREHQEHRARMVSPLTVGLGLGLATLTDSHMHRDSDARRSGVVNLVMYRLPHEKKITGLPQI